MVTDDAEPTTRDQRLDSVIATYLGEVEAGRTPDREDLCSRHADLAPDLQNFFTFRERLNRLAESIRQTDLHHAQLVALRNFADYELLSEIGRGGMGVVFRARQKSLNRDVALKMILAGQLASSSDVRRFRSEAEAVAALDHPNIVPVYEVDEHAGHHFFTMKLLAGRNLAEHGAAFVSQPRGAARLLAKVARAVHHAHQRGILHRDLKPANILLEVRDLPDSPKHDNNAHDGQKCFADYEPYVTDFGLAKRLDKTGAITESGGFAGTLSYAAPEQVSGAKQLVTIATDVYGLGTILYTLLAGRAPFRGKSPLETLRQIVEQEPRSIRLDNPRVDRDLEAICFKCLEKDPRRRYSSAEALAEDLERNHAARPVKARTIGVAERTWRWCRRNPRTVAAAALLVVTVSVASAAVWRSNRVTQARRRVEQVLTASSANLPILIEQLQPFRRWADPMLRERTEDDQSPDAMRLRASLALAPVDPGQTEHLHDWLLRCSFEELPLILDAIKPHISGAQLTQLWETLRDSSQPGRARFRSGLALAVFAPDDPKWGENDFDFLIDLLLAENPEYQRDLRSHLRPIRTRLLPSLRRVFAHHERSESARAMAAIALADLAHNDPVLLAQLLSEAIPVQYGHLYSALSAGAGDLEPAVAALRKLAREQPSADLTPSLRVDLGRRRAAAAVTLLKLGDRSALADVLQVHDDPESLTQFVHGVKVRGASAELLIECLGQTTDESARFALLLVLGEFTRTEVPMDLWHRLTATVLAAYRSDPSSAIHSATGWLLRQWGMGDQVEQVDHTPIAYDPTGDRQWFVEQVAVDFFTFVVFRPGTFISGSPESEPGRDDDEHAHTVTLTRSFALADREVTVEQWRHYCAATGQPQRATVQNATSEQPLTGHQWFEAAEYCLWLTNQAGLSESEQCYEPRSNVPQFEDGTPKTFPVRPDRLGFRLLNEAEWEYACRAGTVTAYYFGSDRGMLDRHGWTSNNAGATARAVASLRPNLRGLFDMLGNVAEWCNDGYKDDLRDLTIDPLVPYAGGAPVFRGGAWTLDWRYCRSANRATPPSMRNSGHGFRIARTLPRPIE